MNHQYGRVTRNGGGGARTPARRVARLLLAAVLLVWAAPAAAQRCTLRSVSPMVFTGYEPFGAGVSATATIAYTCPAGVARAWVGISQPSQPRTMRSGANVLQFDIHQAPDRAAVWTETPPVPVPVSMNGAVTAYGFLPSQDAAAGAYGRRFTVTLYTDSIGQRTDSLRLQVSADVAPACTIGAGAVAFGGYDPLGVNATAPLDAQGSFQVACTRDTAWAVALGPGSFGAGAVRRMANGVQRLQYELYTDAARTTAWGTATTVGGTAASIAPVTLTVYGRVPAGQAVAAGDYADTVQSTINF